MNLFAPKRVILMAGYPGSGKSTLARKLADALPACYISSDGVREKMFQASRYDNRDEVIVSSHRDHVYEFLGQHIVDTLQRHTKIVVDATNLEVQKRDLLLRVLTAQLIAEQLCFVCVKTPYEVIENRMRQMPDETQNSEKESFFDAWKRVYEIFQKKQQQGLVSWPAYENIDVFSVQDVYASLGQSS